ncbi:MAG: hypothetical protein ACTS4V_00595 [Candidatus Hodgkinia cicadicola]
MDDIGRTLSRNVLGSWSSFPKTKLVITQNERNQRNNGGEAVESASGRNFNLEEPSIYVSGGCLGGSSSINLTKALSPAEVMFLTSRASFQFASCLLGSIPLVPRSSQSYPRNRPIGTTNQVC